MKNSFAFFIALRYFFSRKTQKAINVISMISVAGILIGTAALVIVLSVFNGFEDLIVRLYNSFDPDLKIESATGKNFPTSRLNPSMLKDVSGVMYVNEVIEESALAKYRERQYIVRMKGVGENFPRMTGLDSLIIEGTLRLQSGDSDFAVLGSAVAYTLQVDPDNYYNQLEIYGARRSAPDDVTGAFNRRYISPAGVFAVQQEFDSKYILVPLRFAREIFEYDTLVSFLEVRLKEGADERKTVSELRRIAGDGFSIKNRAEQHVLLYRIMKSEKWAVFLILTFILTIAVFNVISSQTMLVIEKKKDIAIFRSMGAEKKFLRRVFLFEGMLITITGALLGLALGLLVCYLQETYGLIKLSDSGTFVIEHYPVKTVLTDIIYVFITVCMIGFLAAWYPSRRLIREEISLSLIANDR